MRRAGSAGLVLAVVAAAAPARAERTAITAEAGAEADTNVQRAETGGDAGAERISAPVARLGAKLARSGRAAGGTGGFAAGALVRTVLASGDDLARENAVLVTGDARWLRPIGTRAVAVGAGISAADAIALTDPVGARTFRSLGADALIVLRGGDRRSLTFAAGARDFTYKPDREYDWRGPSASLRLDLTLWQPASGTRSVELSAVFGFEARAYNSTANASGCPEDAAPRQECFAPMSMQRTDRYQRASLEVTWTGRVVAAASYQLAVGDSNSYGRSIIRHRGTLSATTNLPWRLYGTALATLQIDLYPDGLLVPSVVTNLTLTTLEDENRSSLQGRLARPLSRTWSIEGRGAIWRNLGGSAETTFRRALLYLGIIYNR